MPIAENGAVGIAIGAAIAGQRPIISFHRVEFALLAFEQIVNNAAKSSYISNGQHKVPLVIRMVIGRGCGQGPEHSQSLEPLFAYFPGLKVVMPAFAADAKGMLIAAIEDDNPVIFIEHRFLHYSTGHVPEGYYKNALDGPRVVREGKDVTIVATSHGVLEAMRAADVLHKIGCSAEVLDMRVLRPLNVAPIVTSVRKTGRLVTVDTGFDRFGVGAEIVASVLTEAFDALKAAPVRLGLPDHPTPSSRGLIPGFYPDSQRIVREVERYLRSIQPKSIPRRRSSTFSARICRSTSRIPSSRGHSRPSRCQPRPWRTTDKMRVRYSPLGQQFAHVDSVFEELRALVATGDFTLGKPVAEFEAICRDDRHAHAIGVGSGTDALKAAAARRSASATATRSSPPPTPLSRRSARSARSARRRCFVDCDDTFCIECRQLEAAITPRTKAIMCRCN